MKYEPPLNKWELLALIAVIVIGAFLWILETDAQPLHVTALDCGQGYIEYEADVPRIVAPYTLVFNRIWVFPKHAGLRDAHTRITGKILLSDGSEMVLSQSSTFTIPFDRLAKGMLWYEGEPDWRSVGDRNPHPDEYYILDAEDVKQIMKHCKQ